MGGTSIPGGVSGGNSMGGSCPGGSFSGGSLRGSGGPGGSRGGSMTGGPGGSGGGSITGGFGSVGTSIGVGNGSRGGSSARETDNSTKWLMVPSTPGARHPSCSGQPPPRVPYGTSTELVADFPSTVTVIVALPSNPTARIVARAWPKESVSEGVAAGVTVTRFAFDVVHVTSRP
jgi:hypothetical protein